MWPLSAIGVVAVAGAVALLRPLRPGEGLLAADGFTLSSTAAQLPAAALSPRGVGAQHVAVYSTLARAFERHETLVAVGREVLLVATLVTAVLLWRTARRLGLDDAAGASAVLLAGVPLLLSTLGLADVPAQLAAPWLLLAGWLLAPGRPQPAAAALAGGCAVVAALLAPDAWLLLLSAGAAALATGALLPRAAPMLRRGVALVLGVGFVVVAVVLHVGADGAAAYRPARALLFAVTAAFVVVGALGARRLRRLRVPAIALVATSLVGVALAGRLSALLVCLPLAALVTVALVHELVPPVLAAPPAAHSAAPRAAGTRRLVAVAGALLLAGTAAVAVLSLVRAPAVSAAEGATEPSPLATVAWIERALPRDTRLAVEPRLWAELVHAGAAEDQVFPADPPRNGDPAAPLGVTDATPPEGALVLARFDPPGPAGPLAVFDASPGAPTPEELERRRALAEALLANPTTDAAPGAVEVLRAAALDQRLLAVLAALGARSGVGIEGFPALPGEPTTGLLARRALVDGLGGEALTPGAQPTERLLTYLDAQQPPFAPDRVEVTDGGVLIEFRYVSAPDALVSRSTP